MMRVYARVRDGLVVEIIETELDVREQFHPDFLATLVDVTDTETKPGERWLHAGVAFSPEPPPPPPSIEELTQMRDSLLRLAALRIAPLQDAVDLGEATEAETAALRLWKQYRVAVSRVDMTLANPAWPPEPG